MKDQDHQLLLSTLTQYRTYGRSTGSCQLRSIGPVKMLVSPAGIQVLDHRGEPMTQRPVEEDPAATLIEHW